jgi:hypothetical protein
MGQNSSFVIATGNGLGGPGSSPGGGEIFRTRPDRLWGPPNLLYNGYRFSLPGVKRPGCGVTTHPNLVPRLKKELYLNSTPGP